MVPQVRLELTILAALAPQASVYTIPPSGQSLVGHNGNDPLYVQCQCTALPLS